MKWTPKDIEILKLRYVKPLDISAIALELKKTRISIKMKAARLGLCTCRDIPNDEIEFLKEHALTKSINEMSITLGRSWNTLRKTMDDLKIPYKRPCHNKWTPSEMELDYIRNNYKSKLEDISKALNKCVPTINRIMKQMGLMRPRLFRPKSTSPKPPRIKKEKPVIVKSPSVPRDAGINRVREAMERINKI